MVTQLLVILFISISVILCIFTFFFKSRRKDNTPALPTSYIENVACNKCGEPLEHTINTHSQYFITVLVGTEHKCKEKGNV